MDVTHSFPEARIGLVLPYFGNFPNYFPLFLESCRRNPTIDWLIYTDSQVSYDYPKNVKVFHTTLEAFRSRLQQAFDFPISLESPYKLCDFKATYGDTLREDLKEYDFWGHCDCDLIWGNIRKFITPEITAGYDRILNSGHLILYRNTPEVNAYYRNQTHIDYQTVLRSPESFSFDEWPGISECWRRDGKPCYGGLCFDDLLIMTEDFFPVQKLPGGFVGPYHDQPSEVSRFRKMKHILYRFCDGTLERCWVQRKQVHREEIMYVHLQKRKMQIDEAVLNGNRQEFFLIPNRFVSPSPLDADNMKQLAPGKWSKASLKSRLIFGALVVRYELTSIGKPEYRSRSAIWNWLNPHK